MEIEKNTAEEKSIITENNTSMINAIEDIALEANKIEIKNKRASFYKKPIRKDNIRLELEEETPQEIRRQKLLARLKQKREDTFNKSRGLLEHVLSNYQDDADDEEEEMEVERYNNKPRFIKRNKYRKNNMMFSEWMVDIPSDLYENWLMVPVPTGRRSMLVASKGITKAYNKNGRRLSKFQSALPGGNHEDVGHKFTLLDCIWVPERKVYYVLDVLAWSNQNFMDCDTEFRLFWIQSKLTEEIEFQERNSEGNVYPILSLPNISMKENISEFLRNLTNYPEWDGMLFYHKEAPYIRRRTPLVTWLKPFMLPEILGIEVPEGYHIYPKGFTSAKMFLACMTARRKKVFRDSSMEYEEDTEADH